MFVLCSEKRVGNVYSKAKSFVDYVRRALRRLELDESKVRSRILQSSYIQKLTVGKQFGTFGGKTFPRWCLFRKYSNSCQVEIPTLLIQDVSRHQDVVIRLPWVSMGIKMTYFCLRFVTHNSKRHKPLFLSLHLHFLPPLAHTLSSPSAF